MLGQLLHAPQIDRIARDGMRFDRCLATNSICPPLGYTNRPYLLDFRSATSVGRDRRQAAEALSAERIMPGTTTCLFRLGIKDTHQPAGALRKLYRLFQTEITSVFSLSSAN
jgi:hypothetical protein